jgi:NAD(P)-dependent dehydrogenase (short-subunit alcohol dehydrogenase family)
MCLRESSMWRKDASSELIGSIARTRRYLSLYGPRVELSGRHAVITGGASGIGRALALRFAAEGARVTVADLDGDGAEMVAGEAGGLGVRADVSREDEVQSLVEQADHANGPIDLLFSNAGVPGPGGGPLEATDPAQWQQTWDVNVMAHVWAARAVLPGMLERGDGYLLSTASAAGLLTHVAAAPYTVTKHAAVALAEWLSINYRDRGVRVSVLCPQAVRTPMMMATVDDSSGASVLASGDMIEPEDVAEVTVAAIHDERFLILPHPEVAKYMAVKATDPDRWLAGMRRLRGAT